MPVSRCACPSCHRRFGVPDDVIGKTARCPGCGAALAVCAMGGKTTLQLAGVGGDGKRTMAMKTEDIPEVVAVSKPTKPRSKRRSFPLWLLGIIIPGTILFCCGGGCGGILFLANRGTKPPADIGETARVGDVLVEIEKAHVGGFVAFSPAGHPETSNGNSLVLTIRLTSANPKQRTPYTSWYRDSDVKLTDDLGSSYGVEFLRTDFGFECTPEGHTASAEVYSDKPVRDTLVFSRPVPGASYLLLRLPASNLGGSGYLWLKIPRAKIEGNKP